MSGKATPFAVFPGGQPSRTTGGPPGREYQELWFSLARKRWASVVLVPASDGVSAGPIATSLAEVGTRLRDTPVTAIVAESLDYGAARTLAEFQPSILEERTWTNAVEVPAKVVTARMDVGGAATSVAAVSETRLASPMARVIIAIRPVIVEPLGVAIAQAADAVVLCVEMGKAGLAATRKTIQLVGADRIIGALLIR